MVKEQLKRCLSLKAKNPRLWVVCDHQPTTQAGPPSQSAFSVAAPVPSHVNPPVLPEKKKKEKQISENATKNLSSKKHKSVDMISCSTQMSSKRDKVTNWCCVLLEKKLRLKEEIG